MDQLNALELIVVHHDEGEVVNLDEGNANPGMQLQQLMNPEEGEIEILDHLNPPPLVAVNGLNLIRLLYDDDEEEEEAEQEPQVIEEVIQEEDAALLLLPADVVVEPVVPAAEVLDDGEVMVELGAPVIFKGYGPRILSE